MWHQGCTWTCPALSAVCHSPIMSWPMRAKSCLEASGGLLLSCRTPKQSTTCCNLDHAFLDRLGLRYMFTQGSTELQSPVKCQDHRCGHAFSEEIKGHCKAASWQPRNSQKMENMFLMRKQLQNRQKQWEAAG